MMELPKGWRFTPLCEMGKWGGGGTPSKANDSFWTDGTIPWISSKDMKQDVLRDSELHITAEAIRGSSTRLVPRNSVAVVARSGILEHTLPVALVPFEATYNQDLKVVTPKPEVLPRFLMFAIRGSGQEILDTCRKAGTTVASIEWPRFLQFRTATHCRNLGGAVQSARRCSRQHPHGTREDRCISFVTTRSNLLSTAC